VPAADRVIVAGAGPVGLVAANALADAGVPVLLLEAEPALPETLRGSTFHPPTLDMLERFAVTEAMIAQGLVASRLQYRERSGEVIAEFDFGRIADATRHPYRLQCEQHKLAALLLERLRGLPAAETRFSARLAGAEQSDGRVTAIVETPGGVERIAGRFLVGADGGHSATRQALGIAFEGFTWPERFLVVSTPFPFEEHLPDLTLVNYVADPDEWFFLLRVPGLWRVMFPTRPEETDEDVLSDTSIGRRMRRVLDRAEPYPVAHRALYRVHQRVAARYRDGRVFLAGDAAHINNPLGGMGLNGGIHDAVSLAEKLARVSRGEADEGLLDRYQAERRPIALEYINTHTVRNKQNLQTRDPEAQRRFRETLRATAADPRATHEYLLQASMIASLRRAEAIG
jgi:2-polyprenyl-6-methoxyphenol hydroxylase-like FAD-dependent oxidoreductase